MLTKPSVPGVAIKSAVPIHCDVQSRRFHRRYENIQIETFGHQTRKVDPIEVDASSLTSGTSLVVTWRDKRVVVRHRTEKEGKDGEAVNLADLKDPIARNANLPADAPATDANRAAPGKEAWIVMVQICTHLGCIPVGQEGDAGGWLCPCHGSQYDGAGRIRKGPAPENMAVPVFQFIPNTKIRIG
ncbi:MAG: ubiquinol-cytochrome c reductase iron-sulfur subunit [Mesorhizobium sp.]|nr:MAG: ubiquinol-cytochrome c reductase iron-sulfur subunit [Mesorhizobium sp.]